MFSGYTRIIFQLTKNKFAYKQFEVFNYKKIFKNLV